MIPLIVNADDFGFSRGVNHGIIDAHRFGIVNSTTMMVHTPGTEHAVELAKQYPQLRVGIHLVLTFGKPVNQNVPSLVDEHGFFKVDKNYANNSGVILEDVRREWDNQIQKFLSFGISPAHMDSHHHIHAWPYLTPVVRELAQKYNLPVRNAFREKVEDIPLLSDVFLDGFYGENVATEFFTDLHQKAEDKGTLEVMCHPAYIDTFLKENSSYCNKRVQELDVLTNVTIQSPFSLISFK
ncbi:chitin disaccharide deacetylase [Shimazuella kribbensis]|uniref:chitin disaccharide deacetylase n=1 Tax=Shimazuella kribbensis TaxID=139808 RepID=UPI00040C9819|nr:chitin disaccharide deacetylase [Shimazuella kribbensis]